MSDLPLPKPVRADQVLDVQHDTDPAQDHGLARRIPHLGHALLFLALTIACFTGIAILLFVAFRRTVMADYQERLYISGASQLLGYVVALAISFPLFPLLWHRSFLDGIHWTWRQAQLHWWKLLLLGFALSGLAQLGEHLPFVKLPKETEILSLFRNPLAAWVTTIFGSLFVPVYEEIGFRGFLLPALATAYDWLSLERTPAAVQRWQQTTEITRGAWIFSALVTSALFVSIHGPQLHWSVGALIVLLIPSLVFCYVRVRYRSVAAAGLVHVAYDSLIFLEICISTGAFRHLERLGS
jgi:membrane protease YdiL (CAAX protease family)